MFEDDVDVDVKQHNAMIVDRATRQVASRLAWISTGPSTILDPVERLVLASGRAAIIAAGADHGIRAIEGDEIDTRFSEPLELEEFAEFAQLVWRTERRVEPLVIVTSEQLPSWARDDGERTADVDASARWATPPHWVDRPPAMGNRGPVAFVEVAPEGQRRLVALHEIAHLFCDNGSRTSGHFADWIITYYRLLTTYLGERVAAAWFTTWQFEVTRARKRLETDPDWMVDRIRSALA